MTSDGKAPESQRLIPATENTEESILWHFAPIGALSSILEHGLFATHYQNLSDGTECKIRETLLSGLNSCLKMAIEKHSCEASIDFKQEIEASILKGVFFPAFVTSLSRHPVFDYMWEHYTPGGGVAIGFDEAAVRRYSEGKKYTLANCSYHAYRKRLDLSRKGMAALEKLAEYVVSTHNSKTAQLGRYIAKRIGPAALRAAFVKRDIFIQEQEVRLLATPSGKDRKSMVFTTEKGKRRIYVRFSENPASSVRRILISPKENKADNY